MGETDLRHPMVRDGQPRRFSRVLHQLIAELIHRRIAAGLTQTEVAARIGTSQRTMSKLENLVHEPKLGTVLVWAHAVGLRLTWDEVETNAHKSTISTRSK
jgi:transcriptional regulator with XRE-family HTH domain